VTIFCQSTFGRLTVSPLAIRRQKADTVCQTFIGFMRSAAMADTENLVAEIETLGALLAKARASITRRFIGQEQVVDLVLSTLLCGGHGLLIGLPGLGKTRLVETLSVVM